MKGGIASVVHLLGLTATFGAIALCSELALAQTQVQTELSESTVEVGQPVNVQVSALSDEQPDSPQLAVPKGISVRGPSIGSSQQISIVNGRMQRRLGLTATWQLIPGRTGTFTIGPATVDTPKGRVQGNEVRLRVVPEGTLPKPQRRRRTPFGFFDDDDLLRGPGQSLFDDLFQQDPRFNAEPEAPEEYRLESALDPTAFLVARAVPKRVVIGERVSFTVFAYGGNGPFNESNSNEARHPAFYSIPLIDRSGRQPVYVTQIGDARFHSMKVRELALFPLTAGRHEIGPMKMHFYGSRYMSRLSPEGLLRETLPQQIEVVEPPLAGRPPGYVLGDVGNYSLSAQVEPRQVEQGGSISVVVTLEGTGNVPTHVQTPEQSGVEWLSPTVTDQVKGQDREVSGRRVFSYVVRFEKTGEISLGEVTLPYYDAAQGAYGTARAELGRVTVVAGASAALAQPTAKASTPQQKLSELVAARTPRAYQHIPPWTGSLAFWLCLGGAPLVVATSQASHSLLRRARSQRKRNAESHAQQANDGFKAAIAAHRRGDTKEMLGAAQRSLFIAIEGACGLKARAVLRDSLAPELERAGLPTDLANQVASLLQGIDDLRFGAGNDADHEASLLLGVEAVLKPLLKRVAR